MTCYNHPESEATQECHLCGRPLCPACATPVKGIAYCQDCLGSRVENAVPPVVPVRVPDYFSPRAAGWFSLLPGLGLLYLRDYVKALVVALLVVGAIQISDHADAGGLLVFILWIGQMIYTVQEAKRLNRARAGESPAPAPTSASAAGERGDTPLWGGILIGLGILFLLDQLDMIQFGDIFAKFWPLLVIGLGLQILMRARRKDSNPARP
jgi:hypothetical protein